MSNKKLRDQILEAEDSKRVEIDIPEWGIKAWLRPLDGESRYKLSTLATTLDHKKQNTYITEAYVCESLVDEKGEQIFEWEERALLAKKNPIVIERLYQKIIKLSGMAAEDGAEAEKK